MRETLTNREEEVYKYLLKGLSYNDIAREMDIKRDTALSHIYNIFLKKLVANRFELMAQRIEELENEIKLLTC